MIAEETQSGSRSRWTLWMTLTAPLHSPARVLFRYLLHQRAAHAQLSLRLYTVSLEEYSGTHCISEQ